MNKNMNNKDEIHYTPQPLVDEMFNLLDEYYPNPEMLIENSAGMGIIIDSWKKRYNKPYYAVDINSVRSDIIKDNYLNHKIEYKKGNVSVFNPPFTKGLKFLYKSLEESDYVVALLSFQSLFNIDYDRVDVDKVLVYRKYDFGSCKIDIILLACKKKV